jgi:NAD(P)-dependent dehydrogenase (short-subunit alcohol dehydrogenase family)
LADLGAEVVLLCNAISPAREAVDSIRIATGNRRVSFVELDLADHTSIDLAVSDLTKSPIDVLVHCAERVTDERVATIDGFELLFATHVAGPHRLTRALASTLESSDDARIVWVSSGTMLTRRLNLDDPGWIERDYDAAVAFAETKRAQVVLAELWAEAFDGTSVCVNSMHPGWVDTPAVRKSNALLHRLAKPILRTPAEGADTIVWLAASPAVEGLSGGFYFDRRAVRTHWLPTTRETREDRERLWQVCEAP